MKNSLIDRLFRLSLKHKQTVIHGFCVFYLAMLAIFMVAGRAVYLGGQNTSLYYQLGVSFGRIALILFLITLIPGIVNRFGRKHKLVVLIKIFRRYIGILMYLFALMHFGLIRFIPQLVTGRFILPPPLFELFGTVALFSLLFLFITSNDISVRLLGIWWYWIHRFIYIAMFFVFLHVALQRVSIWSFLMGFSVFLMLMSYIYHRARHK